MGGGDLKIEFDDNVSFVLLILIVSIAGVLMRIFGK